MFGLGKGIRRKLLVSYLAITVPLILVIIITHYNHYVDKREEAITSRAVFARNVAKNFEVFIREISADSGDAGVAILENDYTRKTASVYLARIAQRYPVFSIDYVRTTGEVFASSNAKLVGKQENHGQYSVEYYKGLLRPDAAFVLSPLHEHDGGFGFDIVTGIWKGERLTGLVVASIDSTKLGSMLVFNVPGGGYNITDNNGMVVYQNQRPGVPMSERNWSSHGFVRTALAGQEFMSSGVVFPIDDTYRMGAQVPIMNIGWTAGSFVPVDEVVDVIRADLLSSGITALVVILFAVFLGLWIGGRIVRPITMLADKSKIIAEGSFDVELGDMATGDEIEELASSFELMRQNLKEYVNELSGLVEAGEKMNLALNIPFVENAVVNALRNYFDAKAVWVSLYDPKAKVIRVDHFWSDRNLDFNGMTFAQGEGIAGKVLVSGRPHIAYDLARSEFTFKAAALAEGVDSLITLPLISGGGPLGVIELYTPLLRQNKITEKETGLLMALANQAAVAIENAQLYEETRRSEQQLKASNDDLMILNKISLDISSGLDLKELLQKTVKNTVELVGADIGSIGLYDIENERLEYKHSINVSKSLVPIDASADLGLTETVLSTHRLAYTNEYRHDPRANREAISLGLSAAAAAPLMVRDRRVGVIQVALTGNKAFKQSDIALLEAVASQAGVAIENARLYEREREVAETLQNALLAASDDIAGMKIGLTYRAATDRSRVGGDFYDFIEFTNGNIGVVVGDVAGKGLEAATATALAKMTIRAFAYEYKSPADVLAHANSVIAPQLPAGKFITITYAVVNPQTGEFSGASAGHPTPIIFDRKRSSIRQMMLGSVPLGIMEDAQYEDFKDKLGRDEVMLLYTDGLLEARIDGKLFGAEGLSEALLGLSKVEVSELPDELLKSAEKFANGKLADDVAVVALALEGRGKKASPTVGENGEAKGAAARLEDWAI